MNKGKNIKNPSHPRPLIRKPKEELNVDVKVGILHTIAEAIYATPSR